MMHDSIADAPWQPSAPYAGQPLHCGNRWVCICVCICICISIVFLSCSYTYLYLYLMLVSPFIVETGDKLSTPSLKNRESLYLWNPKDNFYSQEWWNGQEFGFPIFWAPSQLPQLQSKFDGFFYEFSTYERLSNSICSTFHPFPAQSSAQWEGELPLYSFPRSSITSQMLSECCLPRFIVIAFLSSSLS